MRILKPSQIVADSLVVQKCSGIDTVPKGRFHDYVFCQFFFVQQRKARVVVFDFVDGKVEVVGKDLRGGLRRTRE